MYEKPLYPTPDGYRRSKKNPYKKDCLKNEVINLLAQKAILQKASASTDQQSTVNDSKQLPGKAAILPYKKKKVQISEKAAQLIAQAIKTMLRSK